MDVLSPACPHCSLEGRNKFVQCSKVRSFFVSLVQLITELAYLDWFPICFMRIFTSVCRCRQVGKTQIDRNRFILLECFIFPYRSTPFLYSSTVSDILGDPI